MLIPIAFGARIKTIFNPDLITSYRLIGYENNTGGRHDTTSTYFPGGEIGYGQSMTAFYELRPAANLPISKDDNPGKILATVALQCQTIHGRTEQVTIKEVPDKVVEFKHADSDLQFASAVTLFAMLLRQSVYAGEGTYAMVEKIIRHLKGKYDKDERKACLKLIQKAAHLAAVSSN
jgi:Ca-activated chloride channel family protein